MTNTIAAVLEKAPFDLPDIVTLLSAEEPAEREMIRSAAERRLFAEAGMAVHYRGLIEFSNECVNDCYYCGIRMSNDAVSRYMLSMDEIVDAARWSAEQGYGSVVLQSGERRDTAFADFIVEAVNRIKSATISPLLPKGVGITLSVGEQSDETYQRFFDAGAHRYLLRIESSSPRLFEMIHPAEQGLSSRIECLHALKRIGFLVGTGVMIGLPGQTAEDLARDIFFFREMNVDMIGMGPYIVHNQTPMAHWPEGDFLNVGKAFDLALLMIAVTRLALSNVNIAATTALQAIRHDGREQGLRHGANIIMPTVTPARVRHDYLLYEGKPCLDESAMQCRGCLEGRITSIGRQVGYGQWGDVRDRTPLH